MRTKTNKTEQEQHYSEARHMVRAAMETGNFNRARTLVREIRAIDADFAKRLAHEVQEAYGVGL